MRMFIESLVLKIPVRSAWTTVYRRDIASPIHDQTRTVRVDALQVTRDVLRFERAREMRPRKTQLLRVNRVRKILEIHMSDTR